MRDAIMSGLSTRTPGVPAMLASAHKTNGPQPWVRLFAPAELTILVTTAPWTLSRAHLSRAHTASLSDEDVLHLVCLSSYFGHLNRIADA